MSAAERAAVTVVACLVSVGAGCGRSDDLAQDGAGTTASLAVTTVAESVPTTTIATTTIATTTASTTIASTTASTTIASTTAPATTIASTTIATTTAPATTIATTTIATTTAPATTVPVVVPAALEYCDDAGPRPDDAVVLHSVMLDLMDDGTADDVIEAYDVDGWSRLRLTTGGSVVSEIVNPHIDGGYRPLGVAAVLPGDSAELFAVVGEGSAAAEIGVFGVDAADCLFGYRHAGTSDDFTMLIRPESSLRSGAFCFDGGLAIYVAEQRSDGLWDASSAGYELDTPWTLGYLGGSDDVSEGLTESELRIFEFDCFGLSL